MLCYFIVLFFGCVSFNEAATLNKTGANAIASRISALSSIPTSCENNTALFICKNCRDITYCSRYGDVFEEQQIATCSVGQTCSLGTCMVDTTNDCIPKVDFQCAGPGLFPDPDCTKYRICYKDTDGNIANAEESCGEEKNQKYGFDLKTLTCNVKLTANTCPPSTWPSCSEQNPIGPLVANPSYYYICVKNPDGIMSPILQKCPFGRNYVVGKGCSG